MDTVSTTDSAPTVCEPLLDVNNAAQLLHLHPVTLQRWARESRVPAYHVGRRWLFRESLLNEWLQSTLESNQATRAASTYEREAA